MSEHSDIIHQVRAVFEYDERINLHRSPVEISVHNGTLILAGEVENVTTKKCALQLLHKKKIQGVNEVVDRLTVKPAEHWGDGKLRDALCQALLEDSTFHNCTLQARAKETHTPGGERVEFETWQEADREPSGLVKISVEGGEITLEGYVPSPSHKHLIEAISWWLPGCGNVANHLEVSPLREEVAEELSDALRLILEKDRLVEADQIRINTRDHIVSLEGFVATEEEKDRAEEDAWCLSGVNEIINKIEIAGLEV